MPFTLYTSSWSRRFLGAGCVPGAVLGTVGIKDGLKLESVLFVETLSIHTTTSNQRDSSVAKGIPWEFPSSLPVLGGCLHCSATRSISFILPPGMSSMQRPLLLRTWLMCQCLTPPVNIGARSANPLMLDGEATLAVQIS